MISPRGILRAVDRVIDFVERAAAVACGTALLVILTYSAIGRYIAGYGAPEETELTWLFFKWLSFLGASSIVRTGDHPSLGILFDRLAKRGLKGKIYASLTKVMCITFAAAIIYGVYKMYPIISISVTTMLRLPLTLYYAAAVIGLTFLSIRYTIKIFGYFLGESL